MSPDQIEVGKTYKHREGSSVEKTVLEIADYDFESGIGTQVTVRWPIRLPEGTVDRQGLLSLADFARWANIVVDDKEMS